MFPVKKFPEYAALTPHLPPGVQPHHREHLAGGGGVEPGVGGARAGEEEPGGHRAPGHQPVLLPRPL